MKKWIVIPIIVALCISLILGGCAPSIDPAEDATTEPTVADNFTEPTAEPTTNPTKPTGGRSGSLSMGFENTLTDEKGHFYQYEGGEMHMPFSIRASGTCAEHNYGILLFVDGQIQPYKTPDNDNYSYMHTFNPERRILTELIFTPLTGDEGDVLEICFAGIYWPDYSYIEDGHKGMIITSGAMEGLTRLKMSATPNTVDCPGVTDRLLSWTVSQEPLTSKDTRGWTEQDFQEKMEFSFKVNPDVMKNRRSDMVWNISEDEPIKIRFEVWGNPYVHYGLVLFVDNEPVSVAPENLMFLTVEEGYKTIVEAEIDMTGFDGESVIYAALIPRNARSTDIHTMSWPTMSNYFLLYEEDPVPKAP